MTFSDAVTLIRKDIEEDANWRSARGKMHEVLNAALEARHEVQQLAAKRAELTVLTTKQASVLRDIDEHEKVLARHGTDLAEKERVAQLRLSALDEQIHGREQKLAAIETRLDKLREHLSV